MQRIVDRSEATRGRKRHPQMVWFKETLIKKDIPSQRLFKTANFGFNHTNMLEMSRKWVA